MPISEHRREERKAATREIAAALLEDMEHVRSLIKDRDPSKSEIRRLSGILRRFFVDRDLSNVAAPRIGRLEFKVYDNHPIVRANERNPIPFFQSGGVTLFGITMRCQLIGNTTNPIDLSTFHPTRMLRLPFDNFLKQEVLCLNGRMISRQRSIEYAANRMSGVHSGTSSPPANKREDFAALDRIRRAAFLSPKEDGAVIQVNKRAPEQEDPPFRWTPDGVDPVLLELLVTAHSMIWSDHVVELEEIIKTELETYR